MMTTSRISVDGGRDTSGKSSLDIELPATDADQERGLLSNTTDEQTFDSTVPRGQTRVLRWSILFVVTTACLMGAAWFMMRSHWQWKRLQSAAPPIDTNDYILDPNWDYLAPPQRREYTWTVRDHIHNPDGIYRPMILVNSMFPGPCIEVNEGDTIVVHVNNQAANATSIHWHGIYQIGTPHMDGTVGVTQCPIAPGVSFTYEFTVTGQSGTYFWHGHQAIQASDGMHGPLIVHSKDGRRLQKLSYDTDRVVLLSDHYHDLSSALLWQYLMPDKENAEPVPESGLINGRNTRDCDEYLTRRCDNTTSNVDLARMVLRRGQSHRLRFVNVGALAEFTVQLDEHQLAVTEVDGTDVHPVNYHRLNISPAQRYSVVVSSNVTSANKFWMRARMITTCFTDPPKTLQPDVFAVVSYGHNDNDLQTLPHSTDWSERLAQDCKDMNTTELVPVTQITTPPEPDNVFYLRSNFEIGAYRLSRGFLNSSTWRADPSNPTLQRAIDGLRTGDPSFTGTGTSTGTGTGSSSPKQECTATSFVNNRAFNPDTSLVIQTTHTQQTIDILLSNFDDGAHPYHLHGHKFSILASGNGQPPLTHVNAEINRESLAPVYDSIDFSSPLRRDTATVEAYGWLLLRIVADNPGVWAFHCHVSWHAEAGLVMLFLTGTEELRGMEVPEATRGLCAAAGKGGWKGMGPGDEEYVDFA